MAVKINLNLPSSFVFYFSRIDTTSGKASLSKCVHSNSSSSFSIGRRWCVFLYAMSSGFISICIIVLHVTNESDIDGSMIKALAFFTKLGVTTSLTLINLITLEIYPTVIR